MRSQRLTVATNFLPYQEVKFCAFTFPLVGNTHLVVAKTAKLRPALRRVTSACLSCSSSPKKVTPRLCCSLINALATRRLATNFFRYQADRCCAFSLVGNAHLVGAKTALLRPAWKRVTSARLSCSSSPKKVTPRLCCSLVNALATRRLATNFFRYQAVRYCAFSLVGNAHRAFRGGKSSHVPCGRSTGVSL